MSRRKILATVTLTVLATAVTALMLQKPAPSFHDCWAILHDGLEAPPFTEEDCK